jgi:DNA polymerase-3 subunit epsilon
MSVADYETTEPDPEEARAVSACFGSVGGNADPDVQQIIVNPGVEIPAGAIAVHGISNERAQAEGCEPGAAAQWMADSVTGAWTHGQPVVAFNAAYDLTVLDREMRRHLGFALEISGPVIDPFVLDREADKYRKGSRKLDATAAHYGVRLDGAHDATEDALAAGRVAWAIAQRYPAIAAMSLEALHEAQIGWHAARQDDFRKYLVRSGKPADDVFGDWPMRPFQVGVPA